MKIDASGTVEIKILAHFCSDLHLHYFYYLYMYLYRARTCRDLMLVRSAVVFVFYSARLGVGRSR